VGGVEVFQNGPSLKFEMIGVSVISPFSHNQTAHTIAVSFASQNHASRAGGPSYRPVSSDQIRRCAVVEIVVIILPGMTLALDQSIHNFVVLSFHPGDRAVHVLLLRILHQRRVSSTDDTFGVGMTMSSLLYQTNTRFERPFAEAIVMI
jgi:hypothetical protein